MWRLWRSRFKALAGDLAAEKTINQVENAGGRFSGSYNSPPQRQPPSRRHPSLDLEWNSKDQTYDRDLYAFSAFHAAGAIEVGVLLTRGNSLDTDFMRRLGRVLTKSGTEGTEDVYKKFGASTTFMGKLQYRLEAGRNGGCPVLALGITPRCVIDYQG